MLVDQVMLRSTSSGFKGRGEVSSMPSVIVDRIIEILQLAFYLSLGQYEMVAS